MRPGGEAGAARDSDEAREGGSVEEEMGAPMGGA